jgi:hypothetical protein
MPVPRHRQVFRQFEFAPITGLDGIPRLERIGTRDIVSVEPDPDWLTLSASALRAMARRIDQEERNTPESLCVRDAYRQAQGQLAGTALHEISRHLQIWDALGTDAATATAA